MQKGYKTKKRIISALLALCLFSALPVYGEHLSSVEQSIDQTKVIIHGEAEGRDHLSVLLLNRDFDEESLKDLTSGDASAIVGDLQEFDVEKGAYTLELSLGDGKESGNYLIRVYSERDGLVYEKSVFLYGSGTSADYFAAFKKPETDAAAVQVMMGEEPFRKTFLIDESLYQAMRTEDLAAVAAELYQNKGSITSETQLADAVTSGFVMRAFDGELLSERHIEFLTEFASQIGLAGCTKYATFSGLNDAGKQIVADKLSGQNFSGNDQFLTRFNEAVVLTEIKLGGSAMSVPGIMEANRDLFSGYSLDKYWDAADDYDLNNYILQQDYANFEELADGVAAYSGNGGNGSGGGSGSGSGGGSGGGNRGNGSGGISSEVIVEQPENIGPGIDNEVSFTDLGTVSWARDAILSLAGKGIVSGRGNGFFDPDGNVTRAETVKMLLLAFSVPESDKAVPFTDVASGAWYRPYIAGAYESGLVNGLSETSFGPDENITREDLAVLIWRFLQNSGVKGAGDGVVGFADKALISDYARESVAALRALGIVSGMEDGTFMPKANCTRAQTAKMIDNALTYLGWN